MEEQTPTTPTSPNENLTFIKKNNPSRFRKRLGIIVLAVLFIFCIFISVIIGIITILGIIEGKNKIFDLRI